MKLEIAVVRRSFDEGRDSETASAQALAAELATLRKEIGSAAETSVPVGQEFNLTRRAQALRMQHRGESTATIAAALRVPRNEIDLLLKIQRLANESDYGQAPANGR
jgi:hypothetical protein